MPLVQISTCSSVLIPSSPLSLSPMHLSLAPPLPFFHRRRRHLPFLLCRRRRPYHILLHCCSDLNPTGLRPPPTFDLLRLWSRPARKGWRRGPADGAGARDREEGVALGRWQARDQRRGSPMAAVEDDPAPQRLPELRMGRRKEEGDRGEG